MMKSKFILFLVLTALFSENNFSQQKEDVKIALIYPHLTKEILYKHDNSFNPTESWELFFMSNNFSYEMMNDDDLGNISSDIKVVILPSLEVVDEDIIENIKGLLRDGKGILFTGNFAEYNDDGIRISEDYQKNIIGFRISRLEDEKDLTLNYSLRGNTPLSVGLKPGYKILLNTEPALFYSSDLSSGCSLPGKYLLGDGKLSGMIMNASTDKRILWYGFNFDQLVGSDRGQLLNNSIKWLSSSPEIFMNYWPAGYNSAVLIYKNINKPYDISGTKFPFTELAKINYFIIPEIFENSDYSLQELKNPGDVNILLDDFFFAGMSESERLGWLKGTIFVIKKNTEQKYFGIFSYGDFYDPTTYDLIFREGYMFLFSSRYSSSFSYSYDSTKNIYLFEQSYSPGTDYISRINFILKQNGIGYVNADSLTSDNIDFLKNTNRWITTFSELLEWIKNSRYLDLSIDSESENQYKIEIKNNSSSLIRDVGIWISIPGSTENFTLENYSNSDKMTYDYENKMYYLKIKSITGYQTISYRISDRM